jgi:uncharacterized repeat protein (TIGR01451 family)
MKRFVWGLACAVALTLLGSNLAAAASAADLSVTKTADAASGVAGQDLTYTITVHNNGPDPASNVQVTDLLPSNLNLSSISVGGAGSCSALTTNPSCTIPTLANGDTQSVTVVGTPLRSGPLTNGASASSPTADLDTSNNTASVTLPVSGTCTIVGTNGKDRLHGTPHRDVICGLGGNDVLVGRGGKDKLVGGGGRDLMRGGPAGDRLEGNAGNDRLYGNAGNDVLLGGAGRDTLRGGARHDRMSGQAGGDTCIQDRGAAHRAC